MSCNLFEKTEGKMQIVSRCVALVSLMVPAFALAQSDDAALNAQLLLKSAAPAPLPRSVFAPSAILGLAFLDADLVDLRDKSGAQSCFTTNSRYLDTDAAGRVSGRSCVQRIESDYYETFPKAIRARSGVLGVPSYKTNSLRSDEIRKPATNRLSSRLASQAFGKNTFLGRLADGKIDVAFSLTDVVKMFDAPRTTSVRPTYRLAVKYPESGEEGVRFAALSPVGSRALSRPTALRLQNEPAQVERQIIEEWPSTTPTEADVADSGTSSSRLGLQVQRALHLSSEPFSSFRLKIERSSTDPGTGISLKMYEASGIASADMTSLLFGDVYGITWEMKAPYGKHAAVFGADGITKELRYAYEYSYSAASRARISYDPNRFVESQEIPKLDSARYMMGLSFVF